MNRTTRTVAAPPSPEAGHARLRGWLTWAMCAAATLLWFADLARWLAPA